MKTLLDILNNFVESGDQFCFAFCDGKKNWFAENYIYYCKYSDGNDLQKEAILKDNAVYLVTNTEDGEKIENEIFYLKEGRWNEEGEFEK